MIFVKSTLQITTPSYILKEYFFQGSAKRSGRLHEIQSILDDPVLTIKEIHSVRWLSYFSALTTVYRTLDSLMAYLAEMPLSDAKAMGLKKKVGLNCIVILLVTEALLMGIHNL